MVSPRGREGPYNGNTITTIPLLLISVAVRRRRRRFAPTCRVVCKNVPALGGPTVSCADDVVHDDIVIDRRKPAVVSIFSFFFLTISLGLLVSAAPTASPAVRANVVRKRFRSSGRSSAGRGVDGRRTVCRSPPKLIRTPTQSPLMKNLYSRCT